MYQLMQTLFLWLFVTLTGVSVFGLETNEVDEVRITYTDTDNDVPVEWFGLTLKETSSNLSPSGVQAVVEAVSFLVQDEMLKVYDNTDYMLNYISLETVMEPETLKFTSTSSVKSNGKLRRAFELEQNADSRDQLAEDLTELPPRKIRKVMEGTIEGEDAAYLKRTRQVLEETYGTYIVFGGNVTFFQLPTPLADEVNGHLKTILSDIPRLMNYVKTTNHPELSNLLTTITLTMPLPSNSPSMVPSNTPTNSQSPSSSPTPAPTSSPTPASIVSPNPATTSSPTPATTDSPTTSTTDSPTPASTGGGGSDGVITDSPTTAPVLINQGIKDFPVEQANSNTSSRTILIVAVASCSAAFIALSSALLVRRRFASDDPEFEIKGEGYDDFDDGTLKRRNNNKGMFFKPDKFDTSYDSPEPAVRRGITRNNTDSTPKASGRTSRNFYASPDHSHTNVNNSSDYFTAGGSSNTSFSYSAGMQMREAELDAQNRNVSGIMVDCIEEGYPSPPISGGIGSPESSNYQSAGDEFEDHALVNGQTIVQHGDESSKGMSPPHNLKKVVGISPTSQGIEVAALPTGSNNPRIMASWGSWLFGSGNKDSNNNNDNKNSNQKLKQEKDVGAFPRATEEDFFQAEFGDDSQKATSYARKPPPRVLERSYPGDTNRSKSQDNHQSFTDGSFPTFGMEDHVIPMRSVSTRSHMSKNASSAAESSSRGDSSSAAYTMNDLHPLDWSNKGSENGDDDSSLTEHDGPSDAEGQMIYKQYLDRERRRKGGTPSRHTAQDYPTTPKSENSAYYSVQSEQSEVSNASSSKQLINDLVWLEKKISDVRARVDQLDDDNELDSSSSVDSFMASNASSRSSYGGGKSPISQSIICRDCFAPPGRLQIIIHSTRDGPSVHSVKPGSSLEGKLFPGDLILAVDDIDTRRLSAEDVMKMMAARSAYERKITVLHFDDRSFQM